MNHRKLVTKTSCTAACVLATLVHFSLPVQALNTITATTNSKVHYTLFYKQSERCKWITQRPHRKDLSVVLCIPAAFTSAYGQIDGVYAVDGKFYNQNHPDDKIGGLVTVLAGNCQISSAPKGQIDPGTMGEVLGAKGDLFQQFQLVVNGRPERFRDSSRFQRRGIIISEKGETAVVESQEAITLTQFSTDLAELGAMQAAYTDMGPWDEGWYRDANGKTVTIGKDRSLTFKQTNWLIFQTDQPTSRGEPSTPKGAKNKDVKNNAPKKQVAQ